jgi:hypothetical protein
MNAAASSLIEAIQASFSPSNAKWDQIPSGSTSWYMYGGGGVNNWGSTCGIPLGCMSVLNLMNDYSAFADTIMYYYSQTEFPIRGLHDQWVADGGTGWGGHEPIPDDEVRAYTTANSPLCHVSMSKWAFAAGVTLGATDIHSICMKKDRCAKVAAGVAAFTAELLNGIASGLHMPDRTTDCSSCHKTSTVPAQQGKMDCWECHTDLRGHK